MFGSLGPLEIGIIALIVILLFGVGKISGLGKDLGSSIKEFRKAVKDEDDPKKNAVTVQVEAPPAAPQVTTTPPAASAQAVQPVEQRKEIF